MDKCVPMTKDCYIKYITEECPTYLLLSKTAAEFKWKQYLADKSINRDQVRANDLEGNDVGYVPVLEQFVVLWFEQVLALWWC